MAGESARTPGAVAWPGQMITQAEAFKLAADWPVYAQCPGPADDVSLFCGKHLRTEEIRHGAVRVHCGQAIGQLRRAGTTYNGSLDEMLSMVLRHMVMAHDMSLAGLRKGGGDV